MYVCVWVGETPTPLVSLDIFLGADYSSAASDTCERPGQPSLALCCFNVFFLRTMRFNVFSFCLFSVLLSTINLAHVH